jgi:hypothetical protein
MLDQDLHDLVDRWQPLPQRGPALRPLWITQSRPPCTETYVGSGLLLFRYWTRWCGLVPPLALTFVSMYVGCVDPTLPTSLYLPHSTYLKRYVHLYDELIVPALLLLLRPTSALSSARSHTLGPGGRRSSWAAASGRTPAPTRAGVTQTRCR